MTEKMEIHRTASGRKLPGMLLTAVLMLLSSLFAAGKTSTAQDELVTLIRNTTTGAAIVDIERQTGRIFSYSDAFSLTRAISFPTTQQTLKQAVEIISGQDFNHLFEGKYIILYDRKLDAKKESEREFLTGRVLRKTDNEPIAGARVAVVRGGAVATTDSKGRFCISDIPVGNYIVGITVDSVSQFREIRTSADRNADIVVLFDGKQPIKTAADGETEHKETTAKTYYYHDDAIFAVAPEATARYNFQPASNFYQGYHPRAAVKTNAIWWATTSPNAAVEFSLGRKWSIEASLVYNPWKLDNVKSRRFWLVQPEARYWFCNVFEKHFIGLHGIVGGYTVGHLDLPFAKELKDHRYDGSMYGVGVAWGYHLPVGKRWGIEFTVGAGWVHFKYDKYKCGDCYEELGRYTSDYFGPTKAGVSLLFMIK